MQRYLLMGAGILVEIWGVLITPKADGMSGAFTRLVESDAAFGEVVSSVLLVIAGFVLAIGGWVWNALVIKEALEGRGSRWSDQVPLLPWWGELIVMIGIPVLALFLAYKIVVWLLVIVGLAAAGLAIGLASSSSNERR